MFDFCTVSTFCIIFRAADARLFVLVQKPSLNWKWITVNLPGLQVSNFTLETHAVQMVLYSGGENPHTKSTLRELSTLQLASHHAKKDKLRSQRAHICTHTWAHVLPFKPSFQMSILILCSSMMVLCACFLSMCLSSCQLISQTSARLGHVLTYAQILVKVMKKKVLL